MEASTEQVASDGAEYGGRVDVADRQHEVHGRCAGTAQLAHKLRELARIDQSDTHMLLPKAGAPTTATLCIERVACCSDTATRATYLHTTYAPRPNDYDLHGALEE